MPTRSRILLLGSIGSVTGHAGAQTDASPSAVRATTPGAKHNTGNQPDCFVVSEGGPMSPTFYRKNAPEVRLAPALEVRFAGGKAAGAIEGYASTFGGPPDSYGDIIAPGAFRQSLAQLKAEGVQPSMLWSHDPANPIGRWTSLREDATGLFVTGQLNLATSMGKDAYEHLKQGDVSGLSIGFLVPKGARHSGEKGSSIITEIELVEISVVSFPANRRARVAGVKSLTSKNDLVDMLRESGLSKSAAARVAAGGWPALAGTDHQKAIDLAAEIERATANLRTN